LNQREVLIVDDNPSDREAISHALTNDRTCRYHFHHAQTAGEAYNLLLEIGDQIDLIILDWHIPDQTGIEFVRTLKGDAQIPPFPIVLLTATMTTAGSQLALQVGVQDFFTKSMIDGDILPLVARNAIDRYQLMQRLVKSEQEANQAKIRAEDANRAKSMFLTSMSHELRTPLTAVLGLTEVLIEEPNSVDAPQMLEMVQSNGHYLAELLNDILDLAKIEAGHMEIKPVPCNPLKIVSELCNLLRFRADDQQTSLRLEFTGHLPRNITTDEVRFRQILMNLMSNALKFTKDGSIDVKVSCERNGQSSLLHVDVIDTGIGISAGHIKSIFEPFVQVAEKTTHRSGVGLGLAISRTLARALGGDLSVESELGRGSRFRMSVQAVDATDYAVVLPSEYARASNGPIRTPSREQFNWHSCSVLVAEDTRANQFLIRRYLESTGVSICFVENGRLAVNAVLDAERAGRPFDLILMDMQMPILNGYDATRTLRESGINTPIVALTASAMEGDKERCLSVGCTNYLSKPLAKDGLFSVMSQNLKRE
jgi:signal transduction histidine kinase